MKKQIILSVHLPKAGGSTFREILKDVYKEDFIYINQASSALDAKNQIKDIDLNKVSVIHGHFPYGLHELLPQEFEFKYITFLRHPYERLLSMYTFLRDTQAPTVKDKTTFSSWITLQSIAELDNGMVRILHGNREITNTRKYLPLVDEQDLLIALSNLKKFYYIATTETYTKDLENLATLLQWKEIPVKPKIYNYPNRRHKEDLTPEEISLLRDRFHYDCILWYTIGDYLNKAGR